MDMIDELMRQCEELVDRASWTEEQDAMLTYLCGAPEVMDGLPTDFFSGKSVAELNEWFGCHDGMVFDEECRQYMDLFKRWNDAYSLLISGANGSFRS